MRLSVRAVCLIVLTAATARAASVLAPLSAVLEGREAIVVVNDGKRAAVKRVGAGQERKLFDLPFVKRHVDGWPSYYADFPRVTLSWDRKALLFQADDGPGLRRFDFATGETTDVATDWLPQMDNVEAANASLSPSGTRMVCPCYPALGLYADKTEPKIAQLILATPKAPAEVSAIFERFGVHPVLKTMRPHYTGAVVLREFMTTLQWASQRQAKEFSDIRFVRWIPDESGFLWMERKTTREREPEGEMFRSSGEVLWRYDVASGKSVEALKFARGEIPSSYYSHPLHLISRRQALLAVPEVGWRIPYLNIFLRNDYRTILLDFETGAKRELAKGGFRVVGIL